MLCAEIRVSSQYQRPGGEILAEAVIERSSMEERIDIEELRARPDVEVASIRR
jgi:hypothetical protein